MWHIFYSATFTGQNSTICTLDYEKQTVVNLLKVGLYYSSDLEEHNVITPYNVLHLPHISCLQLFKH